MISLTIKVLNGDLIEVVFDPRRSMDALYRLVWDALPEAAKPRFIWQMMLIKVEGDAVDAEDEMKGWIRPTRVPMRPFPRVPLADGDMLAVWFEPGTCFDLWEEEEEVAPHVYRRLLQFSHTADHDGPSIPIYCDHRNQQVFYFEEDVTEADGIVDNLPMEQGHRDPMDVIDRIDGLSPVAKEILYHKLYDILRDDIPEDDDLVPDCPIYDFVNDLDMYPASEEDE